MAMGPQVLNEIVGEALGMPIDEQEQQRIGDRIWNLERLFNNKALQMAWHVYGGTDLEAFVPALKPYLEETNREIRDAAGRALADMQARPRKWIEHRPIYPPRRDPPAARPGESGN